jgi:O-acetyl-ADP-ribose deacetylase (regulator of RNase III)
MSIVTLNSGDLFTSAASAFGHGVNTHGVMGGIASQFRLRWPEMYDEYRRRCHAAELHPGDLMTWHTTDTWVFNLVTQNTPGPDARLGWLRESLQKTLAFADREGIDRIAIPRIGCGIGGLDWTDVEPLVRELATASACDLEVWSL